MQMRRVVITGAGAVTPFGLGTERLAAALRAGESAVSSLPELESFGNDSPQVAGVIRNVDITVIPRKSRRTMSSLAAHTYLAAREALDQAGIPDAIVTSGRFGMSVGSTLGSVSEFEAIFKEYLATRSLASVKSVAFFKIMGNSAAANVAQALGVAGRVIGASAACSSGLQSIGLAYEAVAEARQDYMLCGGADEYHPLFSGTFHLMAASSSRYNDKPHETPRPFDRDRDGVVCSEGAGVMLLETYDSAKARGAEILGEIAGFATTSDAASIASPDPAPVRLCMEKALQAAGVARSDIGYINAHATGTQQGDMAEAAAIRELFGDRVPVSGLKGYLGHTMAASGAIESIAVLPALRDGAIYPTKNLENPAEECAGIRHVMSPLIEPGVRFILKNSFAFGGINCCMIIRKPE